ncbi:MAG: carboxypeptidase regulatory-like domain-containing protein [Planctomycetes bacterium]|nr:carboxypeptidase regulatory-like domain-containing protein [Planctomycetota bacterium]
MTGIVRAEETGEPLREVWIVADFKRSDGEMDASYGFADDRGVYRLEPIVGTVTELLVHFGQRDNSVTIPMDLPPIESGATVTHDVTISIGPFIAGVVVDAATGTPIESARVEIASGPSKATLADDDGQFLIARIAPEDVAAPIRVVVTHPDYMDLDTFVDPRAPTARHARFALRRGSALSGIVFDIEGKPAVARLEVGYLGRVLATALSAEDGRFAFRNPPPVPGATLVARVVEEEGRPRGSALLSNLDLRSDCTGIVLRAEDPCTARVEANAGRRCFDGPPRLRRIDAPGREVYGFRDLEAGTYWVDDEAESFPGAVVTIRPGDVVSEIVATPDASHPAWVSGTAVDDDGNPIADFTLTTEPPCRRLGETECPWLATQAGAFELEVAAGNPSTITICDSQGRHGRAEMCPEPFQHLRLRSVLLSR